VAADFTAGAMKMSRLKKSTAGAPPGEEDGSDAFADEAWSVIFSSSQFSSVPAHISHSLALHQPTIDVQRTVRVNCRRAAGTVNC
jgi:hypothetical protein